MAAKAWKCTSCGHIVVADEDPTPLEWDDGHVCSFKHHRKYFDFDLLVDPPSTDSVIFYRGKKDSDDGQS